MRRSLLIWILLFSLLAGCAPASAQEQPAPLTEADVLDAYTQAAQVYDWFDLYSPSTGIEAIQTEEGIFYPVEEPGLETMADLEARVRACFAAPLAEQLLSSGNYRDLNGQLYCLGGARGSNPYLLSKTVHAAAVNDDHWTVTLTFWADYQDSIPVPIPGTDDMASSSVVTVGYSQAVLDYQHTEEGWRFTSFCASDDLDLDADTVFTFSYDGDSFASDEPAMDTWSDYKLGCWLLHADAMGEGASTLLTQRFLEDPETWFAALAPLAESPFEHAQIVLESPACVYAWFSQEEQAQFEEILNTYQPRNDVEQAMLDILNSAKERAIQNAAERAAASFCLVTDGSFLTLGSQEGTYPWGNAALSAVPESSGSGDNGEALYTFSFGGVDVDYFVSPDPGADEVIFRMFTDEPGPQTLGGIQVGSTKESLLEIYPDAQPYCALQSSRPVSFDEVYVYEPGGFAFCKHMAFFLQDGVVTAIEIEDLLDGRLLS